ncbi:MAG: SDR family oxidoreductase [Candidatus Orphnella occulta]|nr:SDR family oxidoreductase [Candidatus Orphnella occulta]
MKINFKGKKALVTGGTRGIGKKIADDLKSLGADVFITGTKQNYKGRHKYYCVDFTDTVSTEVFIEELKKFKKIDICVNNAGINRIDKIAQTKVGDWDDIVAVNLKAPFLIIRAISGAMKKNRYGRIINISSIFGTVSMEKRSIYSTTKFGIKGLTTAVSNELAKYNILVNSVSPGFVVTDMTKKILGDVQMKKLKKKIPAGRLALPGDISSAVLFLASSLNTYITGKDIIVDGGYIDV